MQPVSSSRCISFIFYIKPQLSLHVFIITNVVYLSFSTSNHNYVTQTFYSGGLYIFHFLHQTTTKMELMRTLCGCISFIFYIKPQLPNWNTTYYRVVYLSFSTSNHNMRVLRPFAEELYIFHFLHQTTTFLMLPALQTSCISFIFYIKPQLLFNAAKCIYSCISFIFYIKPQLSRCRTARTVRCISFIFYIKPQLEREHSDSGSVVYLSFSTSNHNRWRSMGVASAVVYLSFSTSNHNYWLCEVFVPSVVYLSFSTSNHNIIHLSA